MNKYNLRTTLTSPLGSLVIADPQGIQEAPITLLRNPKFKSVVSNFEIPLTYVLRAVDFLNAAKDLGIDTLVTVLIEVSSDFGVTWETFNEGVLDLPAISTLSNPTEYKIKLGAKKDDTWTKLINRVDTDVNVQSAIDVDGNSVPVGITPTITLTPQIIRRVCRMEMWNTTDADFADMVYSFTTSFGSDFIAAPVDLPKKVLDEIKTKNNYVGAAFKVTDPDVLYSDYGVYELVNADEVATKYEIDFRITLAANAAYNNRIPDNDNGIFPAGSAIRMYYIRVDDDTPNASSGSFIPGSNAGTNGVDGRTIYFGTFTEVDIRKGTRIYLITHYTNSELVDFPFDAFVVPNDIYGDTSFINILAHTTAAPSTTIAKRVGATFDAIIRRITGGDNYYSDFFTTGCGAPFVNMLGLHLRGYDFTTKPYSENLAAHFAAADAIWPIGLGYEMVSGVLKVRIEEAAHFFDSSANSINLDNINNYITSFKSDSINNGVDIGYSKWQLTAGGSLIDDPQTIHTYVPPFKRVGAKVTRLCSWVAASLLFELTRRAIDKLSETFDTDNDKFILQINESNEPKLDYVSATNLNDPETRYNKEITPGRNFLRAASILFVGGKEYIGDLFRFVSGLGNFTAEIELAPDSCSGTDVATVAENQDMEITGDTLHGIDVIRCEGYPLTWERFKLILAMPNNSIGISKTTEDHVPYFIDQVDFFFFDRKVNFTLFKYSQL